MYTTQNNRFYVILIVYMVDHGSFESWNELSRYRLFTHIFVLKKTECLAFFILLTVNDSFIVYFTLFLNICIKCVLYRETVRKFKIHEERICFRFKKKIYILRCHVHCSVVI